MSVNDKLERSIQIYEYMELLAQTMPKNVAMILHFYLIKKN